jgi:hypothetical protein
MCLPLSWTSSEFNARKQCLVVAVVQPPKALVLLIQASLFGVYVFALRALALA